MTDHRFVDTDEIAEFLADSAPSAQPITGAHGAPDTEKDLPEQEHTHVNWSPDYNSLSNAAGDPSIWAHEFAQFIGQTTGKWIAEDQIQGWMATLAEQVKHTTYKAALFQVANTTLPAEVKGDPSILLLQLRDDLASGFKHAAGL